MLTRPSLVELGLALVVAIVFWGSQLYSSDSQQGLGESPTPEPTLGASSPETTPLATQSASRDPDSCDFRDELERVRAAVVLVIASDGDQTQMGTGFHIGGGTYVTAAHVILDESGQLWPQITLVSAEKAGELDAQVESSGSFSNEAWQRDIAKLSATAIPAAIDWREPSDDDVDRDMRAVGYPWSQLGDDSMLLPSPLVIRGTLANVATTQGIELVQSSARTENGMSGGPLVDECGTAVAITSGVPLSLDTEGQVREGFGVFISMAELLRLP